MSFPTLDATTTLYRDKLASFPSICTNTFFRCLQYSEGIFGNWDQLMRLNMRTLEFPPQENITSKLHSPFRKTYPLIRIIFKFPLSLHYLPSYFVHQLPEPSLPHVQILCCRETLCILFPWSYDQRLRRARKHNLKWSTSGRTMVFVLHAYV